MRAARSHRVRGFENEGTVMHGVHFFNGERVFLGKCGMYKGKKDYDSQPARVKSRGGGEGRQRVHCRSKRAVGRTFTLTERGKEDKSDTFEKCSLPNTFKHARAF